MRIFLILRIGIQVAMKLIVNNLKYDDDDFVIKIYWQMRDVIYIGKVMIGSGE
jgi:hypothetical protein